MSQQIAYFPVQGGEDLVSPPLTVSPSRPALAQNYECDVNGRLQRVKGYRRYDGKAYPTNIQYAILACTLTGDLTVGDTLTDGTATGKIIAIEPAAFPETVLTEETLIDEDTIFQGGYDGIIMTRVTGTFASGPVYVGITQVGECVGPQAVNGSSTYNEDYLLLAEAEYRDDIDAVPGSGPVLGVWVYDGKRYAFRNSNDGTEAFMYVATSSGWSLITTDELAPDGRYEFCNYNCLATGTGFKMYGVDGKNKAFQFDGSTFTQITTGYSPDTPAHIMGHKLHLFVAMTDGVVQHSGLKDPTSFDPADGASFIGIEDYCSGFEQAAGGTLAIFGDNTTHILYGSSASGDDAWRKETISRTSGAIPYTIQQLSQPVYLDDRGVTALSAVQEYGDFAANTLTKDVKPFIDLKRSQAVASMIMREKNIYRLFYSDGYGTSITFNNNQVSGITRLLYPHPVKCCCSVESEGDEVVLFGDASGFVYEMEKGTSFDGEVIEAKVTTHYNNLKLPRSKKRIHKAVVEIETQGKTTISFVTRFSGAYGITTDSGNSFALQGTGGFWDVDTWDNFIWYVGGVNMGTAYVNGAGLGFSFSMRSTAWDENPHTINGIIIHYSVRGMQR